MATDANKSYFAYLVRDGDAKRFAETHIDASDREHATSYAMQWAIGQTGQMIGAPTSLFMEIDGDTWLVKRWGDL